MIPYDTPTECYDHLNKFSKIKLKNGNYLEYNQIIVTLGTTHKDLV